MIYFIQESEPPHRVKIGFSDNPARRIPEISAGFSQTMIVLKVIEGSREDEKWIHDYLKDVLSCRVEGKREWYHPYAELLDYINSDKAIFPAGEV